MASKPASGEKKGENGPDAPAPQFLFGRMSKKFAQLTKLGRDTDVRKQQLEDLEGRAQDAERQKEEALQELLRLRQQLEESAKKQGEQGARISSLQREAALARQEAETATGDAQRLTQQILRLKSEHKDEVDRLRTMSVEKERGLASSLKVMEIQYKEEMEELSAKCAQAVEDLAKLREEHSCQLLQEVKSVAVEEPIPDTEEEEEKEEEEENDDEFESGNSDEESEEREEEETQELKEKVSGLQVIIDENSQAIVSLSVQLAEVRDECQLEHQKLLETQQDLNLIKEENARHLEELQKSKELTAQTELAKSANDAKIEQLNTEIENLKEKVQNLDKHIEDLVAEKKTVVEEKEKEMEELKKLCEESLAAKKEIKDKFDKEFEFSRNCNMEREQQMMEDYEWKLREICKDCKNKTEQYKEVQSKLQEDYDRLAIEKATQASELRKSLEEANEKVAMPEVELRQLRGFTQELQKGVKVASAQVDQMRLLEIRLREELRDTRQQLQEAKDKAEQLDKEVTETKNSCERRLRAKEINLKNTYDEQLKIATQQFSIQLQKESKRIKSDMEAEYINQKLASLQELAFQKDQELASVLTNYESKLKDANEKLDTTSKKMEETEKRLTDEVELAKMACNLKVGELQRKLDEKSTDYQKKENELKVKEKQLEDLQMQLTAHRSTLDLVREEAEKQKEEEIARVKTQLAEQIETMNKTWEEKMSTALEALCQSHKTQIHTARVELEKAMELSNQKEREQRECITDLNEAVTQREESIKLLNEEIHRLQTGLSKMSKELEYHGREILRVRTEASRQLRVASENGGEKPQRSEDKIAIRQLREALLDKDKLVKKLQEEKKILQTELRNNTSMHFKRLSTSQPLVTLVEQPQASKRNKRSKDASKRLSAPNLPDIEVSAAEAAGRSKVEEKPFHPASTGKRRSSTLQHQQKAK